MLSTLTSVKFVAGRPARLVVFRRLTLTHLNVLNPGRTLRVIRRVILVAVCTSELFIVVCATVDIADARAVIPTAFDAFRGESTISRSVAKQLAVMTLRGSARAAVMLPGNRDVANVGDFVEVIQVSFPFCEVQYVVRMMRVRCCFDRHLFDVARNQFELG